jgi:hypothetical protein
VIVLDFSLSAVHTRNPDVNPAGLHAAFRKNGTNIV